MSTFKQTLNIPFEHPVTSLSISPLGTEAVLAAKRGLYIVNLDKPYDSPKILHHISKWDVADCSWNPHVARKDLIATTSNSKALIWNVHRESSLPGNSHVEYILNKHQRAISDIHWSPFHAETIATCSYDAYVHIWDIRSRAEKPVISFCGWNAGATQVKFNRVNEFILASSHDTDVRIWDTRKGSSPTTLITAHRTKIYGLDWSRSLENELLTCSQDTLVKIWNITTPRTCRATIETSSPCWRARYTPFGNGIMTMPQRKDNNLYLWNLDRPEAPSHVFSGHFDTPTEFVWRVQSNNEDDDREASDQAELNEYQLVTWSKDNHLRLWPINREVAASVRPGKELIPLIKDLSMQSSPKFIRAKRNYSDTQLSRISSGSEFSSINQSPSMKELQATSFDSFSSQGDIDISSLESELENIQAKFSSIQIDKSNILARKCTVRLEKTDHSGSSKASNQPVLFQINLTFPRRYPAEPPLVDIQRNWAMSMMNRAFLSRKLALIGANFAKRRVPSLEFMIKYLLGNSNIGSEESLIKFPSASQIPQNRPHRALGVTGPDSGSGSDHSSVSMGRIDNLPKAFNISDRGPRVGSVSDDSFSEDSSVDGGIGGGMAMSRHLESISHDKGGNTVPFPRLCSASFSPTGELLYFFSPLPHPSTSKFTAYTLTTKNQQPVLQSQNFTSQPKTYQLYESYRNFVLLKLPKRFISSNIVDLLPQTREESFNTRDRKLDYWLDDEDMEDDNMSLYWRKPSPSVQPQSLQTSDFLSKLVAKGSTAATIREQPKNRPDSPARQLLEPKQNHFNPNFSGSSSIQDISLAESAPIFSNHSRRKSTPGIMEKRTKQWSDLGIPFRQKQSLSPTDPEITKSLEVIVETNRKGAVEIKKKHKKGRSEGESAKNIAGKLLETSFESLSETHTSGFGTIVFSANFDYLLGPAKSAASLYRLVTSIPPSRNETSLICKFNRNVAYGLGNRSDLVYIWSLAELIIDERNSDGNLAGIILLEKLFSFLFIRRDFQTLSTILCIFVSDKYRPKFDYTPKKHVLYPDFLTSSPLLASINRHISVPMSSGVDPRKKKSKISAGLYIPFSNNMNGSSQSFMKKRNVLAPIQEKQRAEMTERLILKYRQMIIVYAKFLYSCREFEKRALLLKTLRIDIDSSSPFASFHSYKSRETLLVPIPCSCGSATPEPCSKCLKLRIKCVYCRLPSRGLSTCCVICFHGGHLECLKEAAAFESNFECLTGCGCSCSFVPF